MNDPEQGTVTFEAPRATVFSDFDSGFSVTAQELVCDEGIRQNAPRSRALLQILQFAHSFASCVSRDFAKGLRGSSFLHDARTRITDKPDRMGHCCSCFVSLFDFRT